MGRREFPAEPARDRWRPLISHTIEHAVASNSIGRVIVSTDDPEIAEVARTCGAETPFSRPAEARPGRLSRLGGVQARSRGWTDTSIGSLAAVVHLRPTQPARRIEIIDAAVALLLETPDADAVRSVSLARQSPFKMWTIREGGNIDPLLTLRDKPDCQSLPRQLLPKVYWQNGYVDVLRPRAVLEHGSMSGRKTLGFVVEEALYELDYPEDIPAVEEDLRRRSRAASGQQAQARAGRHPV